MTIMLLSEMVSDYRSLVFLTADFRSSLSNCRSFVLRNMPITLTLENDLRKVETSWIFIVCFIIKSYSKKALILINYLCTNCLLDFLATNHVDTSTKHESLTLFLAGQTQLIPL